MNSVAPNFFIRVSSVDFETSSFESTRKQQPRNKSHVNHELTLRNRESGYLFLGHVEWLRQQSYLDFEI